MSLRMKYIVISDGANEYPVMFDAKLAHIDVAHGIIMQNSFSKWSKVLGPLEPVAAGFVITPEMVVETGGSESLKLEPRKLQDEALLRGHARHPTVVSAAEGPLPTKRPKASLLERAKGARGR